MRIRRMAALAVGLLIATTTATFGSAGAQVNPINLDPDAGTLDGSPVDNLPPHIRLLDIELPDDRRPMRPDWAPDSQRVFFLDAPIGNVWEYDLTTDEIRNLTGAVLPGGTMRATPLSNGDLVLCAPAERSEGNPSSDRFNGEIWVLPRPLGEHPPVPLGESCWEGIAVSKAAGSTRIAWNESSINFDEVPGVFVEALLGESKIFTGRVDYDPDGTPRLVDRELVLDKRDVSLITPALEAQDFRSLSDGGGTDDELIFTAYFDRGGQVMGVNLHTGKVTEYAPLSIVYDETEGIDPAGKYVIVERELTVPAFFPGMVDLWRLWLDGSGRFDRLTTFTHHQGFGANNAVVAPDGTRFAFSLKIEGEEGEGDGILLYDLRAEGGYDGPHDDETANAPDDEAADDGATEPDTIAQLPRTGGSVPPLLVGALVALGLAGRVVWARATHT